MITEKSNIEIVRSEDFKESKAKIVANAAMLKILRSGIYTDKILATIRETVMNAIDSHVQAGKPEEPIEVTLPSYFDPVFKVKDTGVGLDDYGVREILFSYGDPVGDNIKNTSNEFYGCYHIGAKSPWSYVDSFEVIAIKDGVKRIYNAYIDEQDENSIAQIGEEVTSEPNGVEVIVAVETKDITEFISKAKKLFKFLKVKPIVKGNGNYAHEEFKATLSGENWAIPEQSNAAGPSYIVVGGIAYNLNINIFSADYIRGIESNLLYRGFVLFCNIGEIDIAVSREEISYTAKTKQFVKNKLVKVVADLKEAINQRFVSCKTEFEVRAVFNDLAKKENSFISVVLNQLYQNLDGIYSYDFNGKKISSSIFKKSEIVGCKDIFTCKKILAVEYGQKKPKKKYSCAENLSVDFFNVENYNHKCYYFLSGDDKDYKDLARKYLQNSSVVYDTKIRHESLHVFEIEDWAAFSAWKTEMGLPDDLFQPFFPKLEVPKVKKIRQAGVKPLERIHGNYSVRSMNLQTGRVGDKFMVNFNEVPNAYYLLGHRKTTVFEVEAAREISNMESLSNYEVKSVLDIYSQNGGKHPIYVVSTEQAEKIKRNKNLKDKILPFKQFIQPIFEAEYANVSTQYTMQEIISHFSFYEESTVKLVNLLYKNLKDKLPKDHLVHSFKILSDSLSLEKKAYDYLLNHFKIQKANQVDIGKHFTGFNLEKLTGKVIKNYPLLRMVRSEWSYSTPEASRVLDVADYILGMDLLRERSKVSETA